MAVNETRIAWDAFLEREVSARAVTDTDGIELQLRQHISRFREVEWPNIRRELGKPPYGIAVDVEPHWVDSGRAVLWQEQILRQPVEKSDNGRTFRVFEDVNHGWQPTGPGGLSANNASVLAHYLEKGLRLRPPSDEVEAGVLETAVPADALQGADDQEQEAPQFSCFNHEGRGPRRFKTWKSYTRHCDGESEQVDVLQMPDEVVSSIIKQEFACPYHPSVSGFKNERGAKSHIAAKHTTSRGRRTLTLDKLKVSNWLKTD